MPSAIICRRITIILDLMLSDIGIPYLDMNLDSFLYVAFTHFVMVILAFHFASSASVTLEYNNNNNNNNNSNNNNDNNNNNNYDYYY